MSLYLIKDYLNDCHIKFTTIEHSPAYTARETAELSHISSAKMAKTIVLHADNEACLVVVPASYWVDCRLLKEITHAFHVDLAKEKEFTYLFPGCETGAIPPFGKLFGLQTFVDQKVLENTTFSFNAGTHSQLIQMATRDYIELSQPIITSLSTNHRFSAA